MVSFKYVLFPLDSISYELFLIYIKICLLELVTFKVTTQENIQFIYFIMIQKL